MSFISNVSIARWVTIILLLGATLGALFWMLRIQAQPAPHHPVFDRGAFQVIAHRGGRHLGPENTLYTFRRAVKLGVDMLEMDVRITDDDQLVVLHDSTVDRTTNGMGPVGNYRLSELQRLDAGYRWRPNDGSDYPLRGKDIRIPSLREVFDAFPKTKMTIEIKDRRPSVTTLLCDAIRTHAMVDQVIIAGFDADMLRRFRASCPGTATSAGSSEAVLFYFLQRVGLESVYSPSALAMQVPLNFRNMTLTPRYVAAAHRRNLKVHVWTVNEPDTMAQLIQMGVDGIITDDPQRLMKLVGRQ